VWDLEASVESHAKGLKHASEQIHSKQLECGSNLPSKRNGNADKPLRENVVVNDKLLPNLEGDFNIFLNNDKEYTKGTQSLEQKG